MLRRVSLQARSFSRVVPRYASVSSSTKESHDVFADTGNALINKQVNQLSEKPVTHEAYPGTGYDKDKPPKAFADKDQPPQYESMQERDKLATSDKDKPFKPFEELVDKSNNTQVNK
jgi:hypothetical protein